MGGDEILAKTAKGLLAANNGVKLAPPAAGLLAAVDGRRSVDGLRKSVPTLRGPVFEEALRELLAGGFVKSIGIPGPLTAAPPPAGGQERMITLDFTRVRITQKLRQAALLAEHREAERLADGKRADQAEANAARAARELAEREAREAQARLESDVRGMLVKILRPRVEENLRVKLTAALMPKIEEDLRKRLAAALRPRIEAAVRVQLEATLKPKIELEMRTRFARQIAAMSAQLKTRVQSTPAHAQDSPAPSPPDPPGPDVFAATAPATAATGNGSSERLLACLGEATFAADALGILTRVNPAWTQLCGHAEEASLGYALSQFFTESERARLEEFLQRVVQGTAIHFAHQASLQCASGDTIWVEVRAAPLALANGETAGVCGVLLEADATRRDAAELEESSLRLLLLVDESDAGILIEDAHGAIGQVNPAFCSLFGLQAAPFSFEGSPVADLIQEVAPRLADMDELLARMAYMRAAAEDVDAVEIALAGGGYAQLSYRAVAEDGPPRGHIWILRLPRAAGFADNPA